jgi:anti-sigma regulatory factor (Ser/Thr protein kinase)
MILKFNIEGGDFANAGTASSKIKKILKQLNVNEAVIRKVVVALYEAEVNVVAHARKGEITAAISETGIEVVVNDEGPGIEDITKAMQPGFSTASAFVREMGFGAGMGLPNIEKNSDQLIIDSVKDKSTSLTFKIFFK